MAFGFILLAGLYFTPLIVALIRKVPNTGSVAVINVFLGWSIIGWIVSLAMAARSVPTAGTQVFVTQVTAQHPYSEAIETLKDL